MTRCISTGICITETATGTGMYGVALLCARGSNNFDLIIVTKLLDGFQSYFAAGSTGVGFYAVFCTSCRSRYLYSVRYQINRRPSQIKKLSKSGQYKARKREHAKSSVRAKVEHVFGVVKGLLKFKKTRYRGLRKQTAKFNIMFALANLILADRPCLTA